ncbi:serine/threonine-protein kinase [Nocardia sp. IFM 10818]
MARTLAQGQAFAGYRIDRLLGVGGMGEVYLARDRDLPRPVALKLLSPAMAGEPEVRERFLREADTAARLGHPNIVAVYARGREADRLWMAMQYIEGTDVAAVLREGALRPDHAVRILGETARALDHAHRSGVLHRDVKPANILLEWGPEQRVFLADFGIAKALDQTTGMTRTGEMYASFQYASPEQFELRADVDHRADVYALGCTFFHMLTGELPYRGSSTAQLVNGHLNAPIPRPSQRNPHVPIAFDEVIEGALAKNRDHRYNSCGELAAAAARALAAPPAYAPPGAPADRTGAPTQIGYATTQPGRPPTQPGTRPPLQPSPAPPPRRGRKRLLAAAAAVFVLALAIGLGFGTGALHIKWGAADMGGGPSISATDPSRAAAIQAACDHALLMSTYDYANGDAWQEKVLAGATGSWKSQAQTILPTVRLLVEADPEKSRGTDATCTVTSGSGTHYELTAAVTVLNQTQGKPDTTETENITMAMDYVDGRWLCSRFTSPLFPA